MLLQGGLQGGGCSCSKARADVGEETDPDADDDVVASEKVFFDVVGSNSGQSPGGEKQAAGSRAAEVVAVDDVPIRTVTKAEEEQAAAEELRQPLPRCSVMVGSSGKVVVSTARGGVDSASKATQALVREHTAEEEVRLSAVGVLLVRCADESGCAGDRLCVVYGCARAVECEVESCNCEGKCIAFRRNWLRWHATSQPAAWGSLLTLTLTTTPSSNYGGM
jgi:hypothetical protein